MRYSSIELAFLTNPPLFITSSGIFAQTLELLVPEYYNTYTYKDVQRTLWKEEVMSGISAVSNYSNNDYYGKIASGNRINKAADDASGLAISEKLKKEENGLNVGSSNASEGQNALNIADGAMGQITDSLQRVYELSVKSSNTLMYGDEERGYMQQEADQLLKGVADMVGSTNYNGKNLLDGGDSIKIATNPDGSGSNITKIDSSLKSLGLENFDITSNDAVSKISDAMKKLTGNRAQAGAESVGLEYAKNYNDLAAENTLSARSSLADLDIGKAVSEKQKKELLQNYQFMMQKKQQEEKQRHAAGILQF